MRKQNTALPAQSWLVLAMAGLLTACGGSNNDSSGSDSHDHDHDHAEAGGRLIYSLSGNDDTLKMFDQTVSSKKITGTAVAAKADAQLVLSNDGITLAMLEGSDLRIISSGLEHMTYADPHPHDVETLSAAAITNVDKVVATTDHFSVLKTDGTGLLLEAADGSEISGLSWSDIVYPTLALHGGQYLTFTANATTPANTDISVINADGSSGTNGLIWVRPNDGGYFAKSLTCTNGVNDAAQTEDFTVILCGDGTLRWLISDYETPVGHPAGDGVTIHVSQRYPATTDRREGETGEVTTGTTGFIENITHLTKTHHDDDVIAAWSADQVWMVNGHGDHPHRGNISTIVGADFGNIIALAATTDDDALAVLSDSGKIAVSRFEVKSSSNPVLKGSVEREQLGAEGNSWSSTNAKLLSGPYAFMIANSATQKLYQFDTHSAEDDYHLHTTYNDAAPSSISSAVFAHAIEAEHSDDDHDGHDH